MNTIEIWAPRWHDRKLLVAEHRLEDGDNKIVIKDHNFPHPYIVSRKLIMSYPAMLMPNKKGQMIAMRQVPLDDLERETIDL